MFKNTKMRTSGGGGGHDFCGYRKVFNRYMSFKKYNKCF